MIDLTLEEEAKDSTPNENEKCTRPLLCSEEWKEPEEHKVIAEFHKPGLTQEDADIESDLDAFDKYWRDKSGINFRGEYHKHGAPYLEEPSAWEGHGRRPGTGQVPPNIIVDELVVDESIHLEERAHIAEETHADRVVEEVHLEERVHVEEQNGLSKAKTDELVVPEKVHVEELHIEDTQQVISDLPMVPPTEAGKEPERPRAAISGAPEAPAKVATAPLAEAKKTKKTISEKEAGPKEEREPLRLSEVIDISTIETISYMVIRALWGKDINVPIKKDGMVDMDLHIKGKEFLINTNQLYFSFPELVIWHITYTHKGRPVLEIGRGVKNGMKLHYGGAIRLALEFYFGTKEAQRAKKAAMITEDRLIREGGKK